MELTKEEKKWLADFKALMKACPSKRLGFYTIGDRDLTVYDYTKEKKISEFMDKNGSLDYPGAVEQAEAEITFIAFPNLIHSVSG
nr:hypothetical protein [Neorhizobium tomejilense]